MPLKQRWTNRKASAKIPKFERSLLE